MPDPGAFCVFLLIILASSAIPFAGTSNVAGQEFLNNNALSDGVAVLPSGLQYRVVVQGSGVETPLPNTSCLLHYEGSLIVAHRWANTFSNRVHWAMPKVEWTALWSTLSRCEV